ncbi:ATP-binding protein [Desulfofalx alkaliphila]|uniref:ATP-binding protein n=1 Tax=Desulfofalx alkaliphila TaxID=105483 RepID=UPI0004E1F3CA|nr:ATP-binding protein [Desulfofalx alkaliphila]
MRGRIIRGSLSGGVEVKLDPEYTVEDVKVGNFAVIEGQRYRYFSLVSDVKIESTNPAMLVDSFNEEDDPLVREMVVGDGIFGNISLNPMLMADKDLEGEVRAVRTIPPHGSPVRTAGDEDVAHVFGAPDNRVYFAMGTPLEMNTPVCVNLPRLVERCTGIFGKAGTGKTFLTRLALAGITKSQAAVNLIFDAHNEYGWEATKEEDRGDGVKQQSFVKGLKQLFPSKVVVFTLDPESSRRRGARCDHEIYLAYKQITPGDILLLQSQLNLNNTATETMHLLAGKMGQEHWFKLLMEMGAEELKDYAENNGLHLGALQALQRKLNRVYTLPFMRERVPFDAVDKIMQYITNGKHVVIEFGSTQLLGYMLVTNILTKRIHGEYVRRMERYFATREQKPPQLVITIEEAHRFLSPELSRDTIFATIAREMRKYNVTLLLVDQRTSGIDSEVMSQIGTKIACKLDDESDVNALLTGVHNAKNLRNVLYSLDSKQQALILGHAVPMPVVIKTRNYNVEFYNEVGETDYAENDRAFKEMVSDMYQDHSDI